MFIYRPSTRITDWQGTLPQESGYYKVLVEAKDEKGNKYAYNTVFYYYEGFKKWAPVFREDADAKPIVWWNWGPNRQETDLIIEKMDREIENGTDRSDLLVKKECGEKKKIQCGLYVKDSDGKYQRCVVSGVDCDSDYLGWMFDDEQVATEL